jgi:glycosidase
MVLKRLALVLLCTACLNKVPPQHLEHRAPIAIAFVNDEGDPVPDALKRRFSEVLDTRNLEAEEIDPEKLGGQKLSSERFRALQSVAGQAPFALLVETRATFFGQVTERLRWTVSVRITAARAGGQPVNDSQDFPALLEHEHEKGPEAMESVADFASSRLAPLIDGLLVAPPSTDGGVASAGADSVYFIMVDRFANGDRENDADANPADPAAFHGGDFAGIAQHADWLTKLGVGTVWLSPVFAMRTLPFHGYGAYHGYWVDDLEHIEPRFGTEGQLKGLRDTLDARGIGLMLDVVLNHVGADTSLAKSKPEWFHHNGDIADWNDEQQLVTRDLHGLPDFAQEREDVYAYLRGAGLKWIRMLHPTGFRLDAVKHMPASFWERFNADMRAEAGPSFRLLGEMLDGDAEVVARTWKQGGFSAMFDFPLRFAMVDVFCKGESPARLGAVLTQDRLYPDASQLVTLLDNHDLPRIATECAGDRTRVAAALQALYALRGVPSIIWGTELGMEGQRDPANRASMTFEEGALFDVIAKAQALRRAHPSLSHGTTQIMSADEHGLTIVRYAPTEMATIEIARDVKVSFKEGKFSPRPERKRHVAFTGPADAVVVGSGPELGGWKLEKALALPAQADLPVGGVFELKLVKQKQFEKGGNRVLFVSDEPGPLEVPLAWRGS